jgi:hypothetical protein
MEDGSSQKSQSSQQSSKPPFPKFTPSVQPKSIVQANFNIGFDDSDDDDDFIDSPIAAKASFTPRRLQQQHASSTQKATTTKKREPSPKRLFNNAPVTKTSANVPVEKDKKHGLNHLKNGLSSPPILDNDEDSDVMPASPDVPAKRDLVDKAGPHKRKSDEEARLDDPVTDSEDLVQPRTKRRVVARKMVLMSDSESDTDYENNEGSFIVILSYCTMYGKLITMPFVDFQSNRRVLAETVLKLLTKVIQTRRRRKKKKTFSRMKKTG